jgi:Mrp family chromosome partitioning ATPase
MSLMLEALRQLEPHAPVILPLPAAVGIDRAPPPDVARKVERFTLPTVPEIRDGAASRAAQIVTWPEGRAPKVVRACAKMARGILRQLPPDRPQMVALSSPCDGDGKTGLLLALAPELASRTAGNLLVVDANFRKPDLTARLGLPTNHAHDRPSSICPTSLPRLSVLPKSRDFDAIGSGQLRQDWSLVLIDAASLAHPEAVALAQHCDGMYLVVRLGRTPRRAVAEAAKVIRRAGGRLLGCIVVG